MYEVPAESCLPAWPDRLSFASFARLQHHIDANHPPPPASIYKFCILNLVHGDKLLSLRHAMRG
jgi:hypothetical protein